MFRHRGWRKYFYLKIGTIYSNQFFYKIHRILIRQGSFLPDSGKDISQRSVSESRFDALPDIVFPELCISPPCSLLV